MKIAILTSGILPVPAVQGGAVENLTDFYLDYNDRYQLHDITVYSVDHKDAIHHPALQSKVNHYHFIDVHSLGAKIRKYIYHLFHRHQEYYHYTIEFYLHEAIKDIRKQTFDSIIIENRPGYALKLKEVTNAKLVYHLHNEKLSIQVPRYTEIYQAADQIITVSDYIKGLILTINMNDHKTVTVYNGIHLEAFTASPQNTMRNKLGIGDHDFILLFSGRITPEKGIMELIDAIILLKDHPQIKLLVIGSSFYGNADNKNEFFEKLKKRAEELNNRIIFTGFVPYYQMPQYVSIADIAVIPSVWDDPFPTTVLEAQAMGLPIISTHRGGIPEEVTNETAILLDTDKHFVNNLATAILDLYQHPEKRETMGHAALEHAQLFSKERYAENFFKAISSFFDDSP